MPAEKHSQQQTTIVSDLVSVIMPCYNAQDYLEEAIVSVIGQTWTDWELLVIDDGSKDQSKAIAERWAKTDSRIRAISNPQNIGVSKTRNRGIDMASGEWIAFLDSDDVWESEKLTKQLKLAKKENSHFIFTRIR